MHLECIREHQWDCPPASLFLCLLLFADVKIQSGVCRARDSAPTRPAALSSNVIIPLSHLTADFLNLLTFNLLTTTLKVTVTRRLRRAVTR